MAIEDAGAATLLSGLAAALHRDHATAARLMDELERATDDDERTELWDELFVELEAHADAEQQVVYRLLMRERATCGLTENAIEEHAEIRHLLSQCDDRGVTDPEFGEAFARLREVVENHVAVEEMSMIPRAEEAFEMRELERITDEFSHRKQTLLDRLRNERDEV